MDDIEKLIAWHRAMAAEPKRNQAKKEKHLATADIIEAQSKLLKQALEALESCEDADYSPGAYGRQAFNEILVDAAITAIGQSQQGSKP